MGKGAPGSIDDLTAAEYNPRRIEDAAAGGLKASLEKFGDISGIVFNERTGRLVSGHQRVNQLREMGAHFATDGHPRIIHAGKEYRVRVVDWDEVTERAANVTANNPHIGGEFTADLQPMLGDLEVELGDEFGELKLGELKVEIETAEVEEDEVPEPPTDPVTKPGDVWALGKHRVWCGDCRFVALPSYDLLVTDPPYGVSYASKNSFLNAVDEGNRNQEPIESDHMSPDDMAKFWRDAFSAIRASAKPGASYYITGPQGADLLNLMIALRDSDFPLRHILIWAKNNHVLGRSDYNYKHEPILYGWVKGSHRFVGQGNQSTSLWEVPKPHSAKEHPTMKPVELFAKAVGNSCEAGGVVCDPFLGSGTTLIAAEQLGRVCHGVEIEPKYVDVVIERWENLTGEKAKRVSG